MRLILDLPDEVTDELKKRGAPATVLAQYAYDIAGMVQRPMHPHVAFFAGWVWAGLLEGAEELRYKVEQQMDGPNYLPECLVRFPSGTVLRVRLELVAESAT